MRSTPYSYMACQKHASPCKGVHSAPSCALVAFGFSSKQEIFASMSAICGAKRGARSLNWSRGLRIHRDVRRREKGEVQRCGGRCLVALWLRLPRSPRRSLMAGEECGAAADRERGRRRRGERAPPRASSRPPPPIHATRSSSAAPATTPPEERGERRRRKGVPAAGLTERPEWGLGGSGAPSRRRRKGRCGGRRRGGARAEMEWARCASGWGRD